MPRPPRCRRICGAPQVETFCPDGCGAVSYTHLDVYKRQDANSSYDFHLQIQDKLYSLSSLDLYFTVPQGTRPTTWINSDATNYLYDLQWNYEKKTSYEFMGNFDFGGRTGILWFVFIAILKIGSKENWDAKKILSRPYDVHAFLVAFYLSLIHI